MRRQAQRAGQLQPNQRQRNRNPDPALQNLMDEAVRGVVVVIDVAAKAQVFVKKPVERAQARQGRVLASYATVQPLHQMVHGRQGGLNIELGIFVLGHANCRLQQREVVVGLHQRLEIVQRAWYVKRQVHGDL